MKNTLLLLSLLLSFGLSQSLFAEEDGAALYQSKTCWACHGKDAKTPMTPAYPIIAGQGELYTLNQMKDIKSGARKNGSSIAMQGVMGLVSEDQMKAIAKWLAAQ